MRPREKNNRMVFSAMPCTVNRRSTGGPTPAVRLGSPALRVRALALAIGPVPAAIGHQACVGAVFDALAARTRKFALDHGHAAGIRACEPEGFEPGTKDAPRSLRVRVLRTDTGESFLVDAPGDIGRLAVQLHLPGS